jgi:hypothetical protein
MSDPSAPRVVLTPEEFSLDAKERLGHTNGSIYQRRPGIDGFHDGQIMVRLKKHRFIIIDYSIIPNEDDMQAAALDPCISIPDGAGTQKCSTAECTKVGVPILLYDSSPGESVSLYMRSGLCFTCQRNLNEKRRTQKKRKKDVDTLEMAANPFTSSSPHSKKYKISVEMAEQSAAEALMSEGAMEYARHYGEGPPPVSSVLQSKLLEASAAAQHLVAAVTNDSELVSTSFSTAVAAANDGGKGEASAATGTSGTAPDITTLVEDAYTSLSKSLFLLSQWKTSWEAAVAAAVEVNKKGGMEDACSSAAAGVDASSEGQEDQSNTTYDIAAESKGSGNEEDSGEIFSV